MAYYYATLGVLNPLRYRGYVFDTETGLYYLQSRYFNPKMARFINADEYAATGQGILGNNMFAYCQNNPIKYIDTKGTFICAITGAIIGGIIGAINAAIEHDNVWAGAGIGAATGAMAGLAADAGIATGGVGGIAIAVAGGAISSGLSYAGNEWANDRDPKVENIVLEATVGAAANLLTFGSGGGTLAKRGGKLFLNMADDFTQTIMKNTTKVVAGQTISRTADTVRTQIVKNFLTATAETAVISGGAWLNSKKWGCFLK